MYRWCASGYKPDSLGVMNRLVSFTRRHCEVNRAVATQEGTRVVTCFDSHSTLVLAMDTVEFVNGVKD